MSAPTRQLVSAHYREDVSWLDRLAPDIPWVVYSKTDDRHRRVPGNRGQEVPAYLKYIIDTYGRLPDRTLFVHGHRESPHQDLPIDVIANHVDWFAHDFINVNRDDWYMWVDRDHDRPDRQYAWLADNWEALFAPHLPLPERIFCYSGAQFIVDRKLIEQYPPAFWTRCYEWVQASELPNYVTSRIFEYVWAYIFTRNPIEPRKDNRVLLAPCFAALPRPGPIARLRHALRRALASPRGRGRRGLPSSDQV